MSSDRGELHLPEPDPDSPEGDVYRRTIRVAMRGVAELARSGAGGMVIAARACEALRQAGLLRMVGEPVMPQASSAERPETGDPRTLAVKALYEKFQCDTSTISLELHGPEEWPHLTAIKTTGPGLFDWQKLTLGEIVDCLADAGLLAPAREPR